VEVAPASVARLADLAQVLAGVDAIPDLHGGTFVLKSKLRIGTEVVVTFPPERVVAAMAPMTEHAPPITAPGEPFLTPEEKRRLTRRPLFRAGT